MTRSGALSTATWLALPWSAEVAWKLCFGVAVSAASISIAIVAVVPVVAIIARSTALDIVENDAENSGTDGGQQARGVLSGISTGAPLAQDKHDAFDAGRQDQRVADTE
jgi:hypothetical protein